MSEELIQQLRECAAGAGGDGYNGRLMRKAAREIETLRAQLPSQQGAGKAVAWRWVEPGDELNGYQQRTRISETKPSATQARLGAEPLFTRPPVVAGAEPVEVVAHAVAHPEAGYKVYKDFGQWMADGEWLHNPLMTVAQHERIVAALARPAQTEQQPIPDFRCQLSDLVTACHQYIDSDGAECFPYDALIEATVALERDAHAATVRYAAPIAQTAPDDGVKELLSKVESMLACPQHHTRPECIAAAEELRALLAKWVAP